MQQGTLIELVVGKERFSVTRLAFAGEELFRAIQGSGRLRQLVLTLGLEIPIPWYSRLKQDLPHLAFYWLKQFWDYVPYDDNEDIAAQFKNATPFEANLRTFASELVVVNSRQERRNDEPDAQLEPICRQRWDDPLSHNYTGKKKPRFFIIDTQGRNFTSHQCQ